MFTASWASHLIRVHVHAGHWKTRLVRSGTDRNPQGDLHEDVENILGQYLPIRERLLVDCQVKDLPGRGIGRGIIGQRAIQVDPPQQGPCYSSRRHRIHLVIGAGA